jgi:two-component system CheB/CheR fusion protein
LELVRVQTGYDFSFYKKTTLNRRVEKRMNLHGLPTSSAYVNFLQEHSEEVYLLFKEMLIGVTQFFRDPEAFQALVCTLPIHGAKMGVKLGDTFRLI